MVYMSIPSHYTQLRKFLPIQAVNKMKNGKSAGKGGIIIQLSKNISND